MGDGWYEARTCRRVDDVQTNSVSFDLPDWPPSANPSQRTADKLTTDVQTNNSVSVRSSFQFHLSVWPSSAVPSQRQRPD
jgi:hypothetical protein